MLGISIDGDPDAPVGTPATRQTVAIHWHWTTEYSTDEIATALGVTEHTVEKYITKGPAKEVREMLDGIEAEVRLVAVQELKQQLREAGHRSRTAEKPVKIYQDDDGNLVVNDKRDDETGDVLDRYAVPVDIEMGADHTARFYRREEVREILDLLCEITGAKEPDELEVGGSGGGPLEVVINDSIREPEN